VAGSAMHFLMAFILLWVLLTFVGVPNANQIQIQSVNALGYPGPAAAAGLRAGDVIESVDGRPVGGDQQKLVDVIQAHPDTPVTMVVERDGVKKTLTVVPADGRTVHEKDASVPKGSSAYGVIGVSMTEPLQKTSPFGAVASTGSTLGTFMWTSIVGVGHLFSPGGISQRFAEVGSAKAANQAAQNGTRAQSIVGVVQTATDAIQAGVADFLYILIAINVFFGIFNLFPMLPLDGGHVAIAVYEKIRTGRRRQLYHADVAKLLPFTWLMLMLIGIVVLPALATDILHPMANPFG
jgi:membrane-associated protease RseP (regulator of RpoE activity)